MFFFSFSTTLHLLLQHYSDCKAQCVYGIYIVPLVRIILDLTLLSIL